MGWDGSDGNGRGESARERNPKKKGRKKGRTSALATRFPVSGTKNKLLVMPLLLYSHFLFKEPREAAVAVPKLILGWVGELFNQGRGGTARKTVRDV